MKRSVAILITLTAALFAVASDNPAKFRNKLTQQSVCQGLSISCPPVTCFSSADSVPGPYASLSEFINAGGTVSSDCEILSFNLLHNVVVPFSCGELLSRTYQVVDSCGETAVCEQTIEILECVQIISAPPCEGNPATLDALGPSWATYQWSTGETSSWISVSEDGIYSVTATSPAGCTVTDEIVLIYMPFEITCDSAVEICSDEMAQVFCWDSSGDSSVFTISSGPGSYTITVTNVYGCIAEFEILVTQLNIPLSIHGESPVCYGETIALDAGAGFASYAWNTGQLTQEITVGSGWYFVTVTDTNGCVSQSDIFIEELDEIIIDLGPDTLTITAATVLDAGNPGMMYLWSTGDTTQTITILEPGSYSVEVIDAYGCSASDSIYVVIVTDTRDFSNNSRIDIYPNPSQGKFNIVFNTLHTTSCIVTIFDVYGNPIHSDVLSPIQERAIFQPDIILSSGIYFVEIKFDGKRLQRRLFVFN